MATSTIAPALPLTYADLVFDAATGDLNPFGAETTSDLQNLIQDVGHILEELPGSNLDDVTRGIGIETYLSGNAKMLNSLPDKIETQLLADDRISSCTVTIQQNPDGSYVILVVIGVAGSVIPLQYQWDTASGLFALGK